MRGGGGRIPLHPFRGLVSGNQLHLLLQRRPPAGLLRFGRPEGARSFPQHLSVSPLSGDAMWETDPLSPTEEAIENSTGWKLGLSLGSTNGRREWATSWAPECPWLPTAGDSVSRRF